MEVRFAHRPPLDAPLLALGMWQGRVPTPSFRALDEGGALSRGVAHSRFQGEEGEVLSLAAPAGLDAGRVLLVGLGEDSPVDPARASRIGGAVMAAALEAGGERLALALDLGGALPAHLALGLTLRAWRPPPDLRSRPAEDEWQPPAEVVIAAADAAGAEAQWRRLDQLADGVLLARDLVAEPGNRLGPDEFADHALALPQLGCELEILDEERIAEEGLGLLAAVGQGSARPPRLVVVAWNGGGVGAPVTALVGKGITFDTGGLSIKHGDDVWEMKADMAGAAACLGAVRALAGMQAPVNVVAVLPLAENAVSGRALRPGDVVRSFSGRYVEVTDTDAEGRLVLADAVAWAAARHEPDAIIDVATLTGAVVATLGHHRAGLFGNDEALAAALLAAGDRAEEPLWRLPLSDAHDEALKSEVADLCNAAWGRVPDALHAARFLQHFVPNGVRWAHLDIAGTALADEDWALGPKGPTGFGVRLLVEACRPV